MYATFFLSPSGELSNHRTVTPIPVLSKGEAMAICMSACRLIAGFTVALVTKKPLRARTSVLCLRVLTLSCRQPGLVFFVSR